MKTININIYQFSELSEDAKQVAIEDWRNVLTDEDSYFYEYVYEDAKTIANIIGIDIDKIYYSGFYSQGDGACFVGSYCYAKGSVGKVRDYAPEDVELHYITDRLYEVQKRNFYGLEANVKHVGRYYHEHCTRITVEHNTGHRDVSEDTEEAISECLRDFMRWIYKQLENAYEYSISDEAIIESIENNEIEFTEEGTVYEH